MSDNLLCLALLCQAAYANEHIFAIEAHSLHMLFPSVIFLTGLDI